MHAAEELMIHDKHHCAFNHWHLQHRVGSIIVASNIVTLKKIEDQNLPAFFLAQAMGMFKTAEYHQYKSYKFRLARLMSSCAGDGCLKK